MPLSELEFPTTFTASIGYDSMRRLAEHLCDLLATHGSLLGAITTDYPILGAALATLQSACNNSNFRTVPEIKP